MIRNLTIGVLCLMAVSEPATVQAVGLPVDLLSPSVSSPASGAVPPRTQPMILVGPPPGATVSSMPVQPMFTYALVPGHWQLDGTRYVWVPPDETPRPVQYWGWVGGEYVWRGGAWVWVSARYE